MPSLNQIEEGLIAEAQVQIELAMGDTAMKELITEAKDNIKKTWEDLLKAAKITNRNTPL